MDIFEDHLWKLRHPSFWGRFRIVLALSGGADSVALFCAFARKLPAENLLAVHVNHGLRGEESEGDARFAAELADRYDVSFREERIDLKELKEESGRAGSLEGGARAIRYRLLLANAESFGARYILTAHHADDQIETVLYRLFRGSGIDGLSGMSWFRRLNDAVVLARPFLSFSRKEIHDYLHRLGETWRIDSSNVSSAFLRNRIRNELLPLLNDLFPNRVSGSVLGLASHTEELKRFLGSQLDDLLRKKKILFPEEAVLQNGTVTIPLTPFAEIPEYFVRIWFRRLWTAQGWPMGGMDAERWRILSEMAICQQPSFREFSGGVAVRLEEGVVRVFPPESPK